MSSLENCKVCNYEARSIGDHIQHQRVHETAANFRFVCPVAPCHCSFKSYITLDSHVSSHAVSRTKVVSAVGDISCGLRCEHCSDVLACVRNVCDHYIDHLKRGDHVKCPLASKCSVTRLFKSATQLRPHLSVFHPGWTKDYSRATNIALPTGDFASLNEDHEGGTEHASPSPDFNDDGWDTESDNLEDSVSDSDSESFVSHASASLYSNDMILDYLAKFYAKLEGKLLVPASTVQKVCNSLTFLSEIAQMKLKYNLQHTLKRAGLDEEQIESIVETVLISDVFYNAHHKTSLCESLATEHLRKTYFKKHFMYVEPQEINLNSRDPHDRSAVVQYVSVKQTLEVMLQDPSVQKQVDQSFVEVNDNPNLIKNYTDGSVFKKRHVDPKRIDLLLFQDAFLGATNPLGSAKNKYKTLGVYMTVGNLMPEDRSLLVSKRLVELVYERLTKEENLKDGLTKCFKKLAKELEELEETGIEYKDEMIPVCVQFFLGDNLGQHTIGGFLESFSSEYFCRFCTKTKTQYHLERAQEQPVFSQAKWRTPNHFQRSLLKKGSAPSYKGIKRNFVFHKLKSLNVCDPSLPSCLGHDLFIGGVVDCDLASMISYFVLTQKWFSYKFLQKRIKNFKCLANDSGNKPAEINKKGKKLGGHAVQNWCLLRILPFLIGEKIVDTSDPVWKLYLLLKSIVEILCAPALFTSQIRELQAMLDEYMMKRKILQNKYKPKHHYFSHSAKLWKKFGPLIHLWSMGFEQFHQFFKRVGRVCNNFINLLSMFANKHQLMQAYQSTGILFDCTVSHVDGFQLVPESFRKQSIRSCIQNANFSPDALVVNKLIYKGLTLQPKQFLLLGPAESGVYVGKIEAIVHDNQDYSVIVTRYNANFWEDYGIHKIVKSSKEVAVLHFSSLAYPRPHAVYEFMEEDCVSLKHVFPIWNQQD